MIFLDDSHVELIEYIILIVLFSLSAFFSSSETALTSISKVKLRSMLDNGVKNSEIVEKLLDNRSKLLTAILIGNNIVNILATSMSTSIATRLFGSSGVGIATGIVTIIVLVFGEITPKNLAAANSEKVSAAVSKPIYACMVVLTPVIYALNVVTGFVIGLLTGKNTEEAPAVTEAELISMVNVSHEEGIIEHDEKEMLSNIVDFGDCDARDVMIPRVDMVAVPIDADREYVEKVYKQNKFTRMPVYENTADNIVGILSVKDIYFMPESEKFSIKKLMKEPYFTYESKPSKDLLAVMRKEKISLAIVLDEYGGTSGIVTLEDILEEIVGEISDDNNEHFEEITEVSEGEYVILGNAKIDDVNETIGSEFDDEDFDSIGGYVSGAAGRFPKEGEVITDGDYTFIIEKTDKNRIERLRVKKSAAEGD
ncbi:MAG: hemolysin family protein [Clostridiales bacterium]|nr:hemolysin family protein [Clostridiales bacterium]